MESRKDKKKGMNIWLKIIMFLISVGLWSAVTYYGYTYAKEYVDSSINKVQIENASNIKELTEEVESLTDEIYDLRKKIRDADDSINDSTEVQENIDKKLKALDSQLQRLESSLKILQEAPNVKN